jgi:TRAP-type C4-dicarboxylate transport system permease small subunit
MRIFDGIIRRLENVAIFFVGVALAAMMLIVTTNVALRYLFNAPFSWSYDVIDQYLMVAAFFLAVSYTLRTNGHMEVDVFVAALTSLRLLAALRLVGDILSLLLTLGIAYEGYLTTVTAWTNAEFLPGVIAFPTWPSHILVPIGMGILALRLLYRIFNDVHSLALNRSLAAARHDATEFEH